MNIDPNTLLFTDLTDAECEEMAKWAHFAVLYGGMPSPYPQWIQDWFRFYEARHGCSQTLLTLATIFPQRVLLAVVNHLQKALLCK